MNKETNYFTHDFNARNDEKMLVMRSMVHTILPKVKSNLVQLAGMALYWTIIEMMNESSDKKLSLNRVGAISMQANCDIEFVQNFIDLCSKSPIELFTKNGEFFWSESVLRRAKIREEKKKQNRKNALSKNKSNKTDENDEQTVSEQETTEEQPHSDGLAIAQPNEAKKGKEIKEKKETTAVAVEKEEEGGSDNRSDDVTRSFAVWKRPPRDLGEIQGCEGLLTEFGFEKVKRAFYIASERSSEKNDRRRIDYVRGILNNPGKDQDKFSKRIGE